MDNSESSSSSSRPWFRWFVLGLLLVLILAGAGYLYENIAEARDRRFNRMPGQLVDVGSYRIHLNCTGDGSPTVVLDSGLGDTYISWRKVQPEVAKFTRVCSYDRAGLGYSDPSPHPRSSQVFAAELHELLQAAAISPPYIVVGHSMGGLDMLIFTKLYRSDVAGVILVDSSHPDQERRLPLELKKFEGTQLREDEILEFTMPFGISRLLGLCDDNAVARAAECNFHSAREGVDELKAFPQSARQASGIGSLGDIPLAVLSHDPDKPSSEFPPDLAKVTNDAWEKMQDDLAHLSIRGTRTIAKNSSHYIQLDRPDVVVSAIRNVIDQAAHPLVITGLPQH